MIKKENLIKSLNFFEDIDLNSQDIILIYDKFKEVLKDTKVENFLSEKISNLNYENERENIKALMNVLIKKLDIDEFNELLRIIIKDESLSEFLQDFFLEKLI